MREERRGGYFAVAVSSPNTHKIMARRLKFCSDTPQVYEDIHMNDITLDGVGTVLNISLWTYGCDFLPLGAATQP